MRDVPSPRPSVRVKLSSIARAAAGSVAVYSFAATAASLQETVIS